MIEASFVAYVHYISIFVVVSALVTEMAIFSKQLTRREMKIIQRVDAFYGLGAILVLITGIIRVFYLGKGLEYYFANHIFLTKIGLFLIVGLLSIYPTVRFLRWRKLPSTDSGILLGDKEYLTIRRLLVAEVTLVFLIPLLAAMMARGLG